MVRQAVKLLLLDPDDRLLLIQSRNTDTTYWYPVGGGIEPGESLQQAASREAYEETGLRDLPTGVHVWRRDHTYEYEDQRYDVHEEWLMHRVDHFDPAPAELTPYEARTILAFRWWSAAELEATRDTVYPPTLGRLLTTLLTDSIQP
ncbi:NUDIX domain-containing protein [Kribbella sp. NPDC051137]|uniref:NUDIX hydrolase n=1 Tax=Kribbella sp. NPDC051137 TaxID=3155045 RepID=UPI002F50046A